MTEAMMGVKYYQMEFPSGVIFSADDKYKTYRLDDNGEWEYYPSLIDKFFNL
jgi:hypothetical protein